MPSTLTLLRCPASATPETRTVNGGEYSVGRGPGVDWVLPDPDHTISRRHFIVADRSGAWQISDESSNGTFINRDDSPVGKGNPATCATMTACASAPTRSRWSCRTIRSATPRPNPTQARTPTTRSPSTIRSAIPFVP